MDERKMAKTGRRKIEALNLRRESKEREVNNFQERKKVYIQTTLYKRKKEGKVKVAEQK